MLCPNCKNDFDTRFCPSCGYSPETSAGVQPPHAPEPPPVDGTYQQQYAGYQPPPIIINNTPPVPARSSKQKWVAFFLCLLFGGLGIHRFYVGKVGTGILFICTFWGFFGVGVVFDLIMILIGSFTDKQGNFLV